MANNKDAWPLFYGGEEHAAQAGELFTVTAPADGSPVGQAARARSADVDAAVQAARRGFAVWASLPPADRELVLLRAADLLEANVDTLFDLVIDESGSTISKARFEITYGANLLRTAAGEARRLYGETFPNDKPHRMSFVIREPVGVVAVISPFNAPLVLLIKMIAFALAAGNAVIAKPSEETPLIAVELARILHEAGMPAGTFNVLTGFGGECGAPLVSHTGIDGVAFTGSTGTGLKIGQAAVARMIPMQLELGGNNPLLVLNDVDISEAAEIAAVGAFFHGGQICMSSARILVEQDIARPFAEALAAKATALHLGDLRDPRTAYGPLINAHALAKVARHIAAAIESGAELLAGGAVHEGLVYQPTVLYAPDANSEAWQEETFGPVACVRPVADLEDAIAAANASDYGLSGAVLTNDLRRGFTAAQRIRCGSMHIGMHSFQSDALAPIGGFGMSGSGRSGGRYSVEHFTEVKWISIELGDAPRPF